MKLSKVLLGSAIALSLVFGFASCADDEGNAFKGKTVDFDNSYIYTKTDSATNVVTVEHAKADEVEKKTSKKGYDNNGLPIENATYYYRAFKKLATNHYGSTCVITITPKSENSYDGVEGFVFDLTDGENSDTYNFLVVALRYDAGSKTLGTYISKYENALIKDNNFTDSNNFTKADKTTADEKELLKGSNGAFASLTGASVDSNGNIVVAVKVEQDSTTGNYTVAYYPTLEDSKAGKNALTISGTTGVNDATVTVNKDSVVIDDSGIGGKGYVQGKMAMYANIYPGKYMHADFAFKDTVGNDIPFEEDIIEE